MTQNINTVKGLQHNYHAIETILNETDCEIVTIDRIDFRE